MRGWFVTGTDTGVGKTWVSVALLHALRARGMRALAMKPVASGCERTPEGLRNHDAMLLREASSESLEYKQVNPYAFEPPVPPHIAALQAGVTVCLDDIAKQAGHLALKADALIVEGVGGWRVPLGETIDVSDLAMHLKLPVILVVGLRLGCINHALLTVEGIARKGLHLAGWIANPIDPGMRMAEETVREIAMRIPAPLLGLMPYLPEGDPREAARTFDLQKLIEKN